jgi:hypothetical protein
MRAVWCAQEIAGLVPGILDRLRREVAWARVIRLSARILLCVY